MLVSALPFYLAQVLWLYPLANGWQQAIVVTMAVAVLVTSAQFGLADLSRSYDVDRIVTRVIWLSGGYIVALLVYIVIDKNIRLMRAKVKAREQANFQGELNKSMRTILADLREGLKEEAALRHEFGDLAVDSHLQMMRGIAKKDNSPFKPSAQLDGPGTTTTILSNYRRRWSWKRYQAASSGVNGTQAVEVPTTPLSEMPSLTKTVVKLSGR